MLPPALYFLLLSAVLKNHFKQSLHSHSAPVFIFILLCVCHNIFCQLPRPHLLSVVQNKTQKSGYKYFQMTIPTTATQQVRQLIQ